MKRVLILVLLAATLGGCGLLLDPCGDLDERLCADLGADCATFRSEQRIHEAVVPVRRRRAERAQCEMFAADVNYSSYTLPYVRYLVAQHHEPRTRMPRLPQPQPADGIASGVSSWLFCLVPFLAIGGILFVGWRTRRKLAAAKGAGD